MPPRLRHWLCLFLSLLFATQAAAALVLDGEAGQIDVNNALGYRCDPSGQLDIAEIADPCVHHGRDQVFFGATVTYVNQRDEQRTVTIKGIDEVDNLVGEISWVSPIARALLKARVGDELQLMTPGGLEQIEVIDVRYPAPDRSGVGAATAQR